jgi:hypothetical protein
MTQSGTTLLKEIAQQLAAQDYRKALERLRQGLNQLRRDLSREEWRSFCAQTFAGDMFNQHPLSRLLKTGPLGAARGLFPHSLLLDVMYGIDKAPADLPPAAEVLRDWELSLHFCVSLRARHQLFVRELGDLGNTARAPRVLAVGCGHLREAAAAFSLENMRGAELVAFDRDRSCIDLIEREYHFPGLRTISGSLRQLTSDSTLGEFNFIYLPTLLDTFEDFRVRALLSSLLPMLKRGGRLLAANFSPELGDAAFLEACLDWWPFYRGEEEWAALLGQLSGQNIRGQAVFRDDSGGSIFVDLQAI